jgi:hypothetical protein
MFLYFCAYSSISAACERLQRVVPIAYNCSV